MTSKRDALIVSRYRGGMSQVDIAAEVGLTRGRVQQILTENGLSAKDGAAASRYDAYREQKVSFREWWRLQKQANKRKAKK